MFIFRANNILCVSTLAIDFPVHQIFNQLATCATKYNLAALCTNSRLYSICTIIKQFLLRIGIIGIWIKKLAILTTWIFGEWISRGIIKINQLKYSLQSYSFSFLSIISYRSIIACGLICPLYSFNPSDTTTSMDLP